MKKPLFPRNWQLLMTALALSPCIQAANALPEQPQLQQTEFSSNFGKYFKEVASDELQGRAPATVGEERTVAYIEQNFKRLGLTPFANNSYRQAVPVVQIDPVAVSALTFSGDKLPTSLAYKTQMMAWSTRMLPQIEVKDSELVFVGYGIVAPEYGWNDYKNIDVKGKTVVMFVNDPGFATGDPKLFTGKAMTYYGRWTYKFEEAARQGAAMALIVHETDAAAYGWNVVAGTSPIRFELADPNKNQHKAAVEGWVTTESATQIFAASNQTIDSMRKKALDKNFQPFVLGGKANISIKNQIREIDSSNVIGYIKGSKQPDELVLYMAHWDHFGLDFSRKDDKIFNGAQDNAGGIAGLLALAEKFQQGEKPERSVAFIAVTAEERGMLGSRWYAANPLLPLNKTVAGINMDVMNVYGPMRDVQVFGYGASELEPMLHKYAKAQGRYIGPEPTPEDGFYYRSDHFQLARYGVPMLYARGGVDSFAHGKDWGLAQRRDYTSNYYHKVNDEFSPAWDLRGSQQDLWLYYQVGQELANSTLWPNWYAGKEFKAARDASRALLPDPSPDSEK
ncbi:M20/M25/M40 family metallo-hydrolase [Rheinheimera riviphila]|uniref:M20/M25/M40 family metallo-hydrolase n=1 Tax=Rheinheimera riviphila TaxID=1834037 RepID=A0A437QJ54_9GAMM|nr:M28 family metallopeptidase [Rheinheimera riviphila]RVU34514.1 M20/M25/M40 family metallo-hydrolase [Rheinheimera riviphila]